MWVGMVVIMGVLIVVVIVMIFCMAHYADDIECMRRNEWRDDEEDVI